MNPASSLPPLVLFEDDHLLVIHKPAGWNTHAPSPYAGEGVYDWLRHREPRWAGLAVIHRLDKETSGVLVFAKSPEANRSLTTQFTVRAVDKVYLLLTDRPVPLPRSGDAGSGPAGMKADGSNRAGGRRAEVDTEAVLVAVSTITRAGERYVSRPLRPGGDRAETRFRVLESCPNRTLVEARPITGRTHQIRVHAAAKGFPILGDTLYGGTAAPRIHLHAAALTLKHPVTGETRTFSAAQDFDADPRQALRHAFIDAANTNAFRLLHGAADGWPGWYVDRLGDFLLSQSEPPLAQPRREWLAARLDASRTTSPAGAYHKALARRIRGADVTQASPQWVLGAVAPERFEIVENGVRFELSFAEGYSVGLFLDQRDNRRRFLVNHVAAGFPLFTPDAGPTPDVPRVLNTFAYTCGFSVCAALAGAHTTSLDLSRKYLDWGRRNFVRNGLDPDAHEFIFGDTFDWLRRLSKKGRSYDVIILDPPTFSQSKASGVFRAEKDFGGLVTVALPLLKPGGVLLASTNAATLAPETFVAGIEEAVRAAGRRVTQRHYVPQPPDFPITRDEPGYLKTVWVRMN